MRRKVIAVWMVMCLLIFAGCGKADSSTEATDYPKYDMEKVVGDETFHKILQGSIVPVEIIFGIGGESGYETYSTKDPEMIQSYIEAFRKISIKMCVTEADEKVYIMDGIEDYTFIMEDGSKCFFSTYCSLYMERCVNNENIQYVLEHVDELKRVNDENRNKK